MVLHRSRPIPFQNKLTFPRKTIQNILLSQQIIIVFNSHYVTEHVTLDPAQVSLKKVFFLILYSGCTCLTWKKTLNEGCNSRRRIRKKNLIQIVSLIGGRPPSRELKETFCKCFIKKRLCTLLGVWETLMYVIFTHVCRQSHTHIIR